MRPLFPEPSEKEDKPAFDAIPADILRQIEKIASDKIVGGKTAWGGLSAAAGFVLDTASGAKVFAKGSHPADMAHATQNLRQDIAAGEITAVKNLAPRFLGMAGDGNEDGWLLGVWEYIDARRAPTPAEMISALCAFQQDKAPSLTSGTQQNYISLFLDAEKKWKRLRDEKDVRQKFVSLFENPAAGGEWLTQSIAPLCGLQETALSVPAGLLHGDLRADNFLFDGKKPFVIDWPNACRGPLSFDPLFLFANLEALGMISIDDAFRLYENGGGAIFGGTQKAAMAARIAGFFADQAYRAIPPRLPRLRWMQKGMLAALLFYLAGLGIIDSPPRMQDQNT